MLDKNKEKEKRKERPTWQPFYTRITKDKKKYTRKTKHKNKSTIDW